MNKSCEKLDMFVSYEINIGESGKTVLQSIVGRMGNTEEKAEFDICKTLVSNALLNLIADDGDIIPQEDFATALSLLEICKFENAGEIADLVSKVQGQPEGKPLLKRPNEIINSIRKLNRAMDDVSCELVGAIMDYQDLR